MAPRQRFLCICSTFGCGSHVTQHLLWEGEHFVSGKYLSSQRLLDTHIAADAKAARGVEHNSRNFFDVSDSNPKIDWLD